MSPEEKARQEIDRLLTAAGWAVQDVTAVDIHAASSVAIREFPLDAGYGFADYLLYVDAKAAGVIEAKKQGATLTGVEIQSGRYAQGLAAALPAWSRPLSFLYESTGLETHFTNGLDPEPRARNVFAFHTPHTLAHWLSLATTPAAGQHAAGEGPASYEPGTFLHRARQMPELVTEWADFKLWPAQNLAIGYVRPGLATFLINAVVDQVVKTRGLGVVSCLAYSNPAWYAPRQVLGASFGLIVSGDVLLLYRDGRLRSVAEVASVVDEVDGTQESDFYGLPVRLLRGKVQHRLDVSVGAAMKRIELAGLPVPDLVNARRTGFKQGAFCSRVAEETLAAILRD